MLVLVVAVAALLGAVFGFTNDAYAWGLPDLAILAPSVTLLFISVEFLEVKEDERVVIAALGKYEKTLEPGPHLIVRGIERIAWTEEEPDKGKRSTREYAHIIIAQDTFTKEGLQIKEIRAVARTRLKTKEEDPLAAYKNTYVLGIPITRAIPALGESIIRTSTGAYDLFDIWDDATKVEGDQVKVSLKIKTESKALMEEAFQRSLDRWGEHLEQLDILEVIPSPEVLAIIEGPYRAILNAKVAVTNAKALGDAAKEKAEGEAKSITTLANADRDAAIARAEGVREALKREATGEAEAFHTVAKSLGFNETEKANFKKNSQIMKEAVNFILARRKIHAAVEIGKGGKLLIVPENSGALAGLLGMVDGMLHQGEETPSTAPATPTSSATH